MLHLSAYIAQKMNQMSVHENSAKKGVFKYRCLLFFGFFLNKIKCERSEKLQSLLGLYVSAGFLNLYFWIV